jgi:hypothetical protein
MHQFDSTFIKLDDDETCALLKPNMGQSPPINHIANEILAAFKQFPEAKKRVLAKLASTGELNFNP